MQENRVFIGFLTFQIVIAALILTVTASPAPQLFENGFSPLLARYANAPQSPASTVHASHVAALAPISYIAPYPYIPTYSVSFLSFFFDLTEICYFPFQ